MLLSLSESYSQDPTPRFNNCEIVEEHTECNPDDYTSHREYIRYPGGCIIEVDYLIKFCTVFSIYHNYKMEMVGWRVLNSPACSLLFSQLYSGGVLNEIKAREVQQFLYEAVATRLFASFRLALTNSQRDDFYACDSEFKPQGGWGFFQAYDATCIAHCVTTGYDVVNVSGGSNPFELTTPGTYDWIYVTNKKCSDDCCLLYVDFCWDVQAQKWRRTVERKPFGTVNECPIAATPSELCVPPPSLIPRVTHITGAIFTGCTFNCSGLDKSEFIFFN